MSSALSPGNDRPHIATAQDGFSQTASSLWSTDECLFIHLQAELALAVVSLSIASAFPLSGSITYQNFCQFFEEVAKGSPEGVSECTTSIIPKSEIDYCSKEEELVASVWWKTQNLVIKARHAGGSKQLKWWLVTPGVFDEYRDIRSMISYNTEVENSKVHPTIWAFLNRVVREKFLYSCTAKTTSASTDKSGIASGVVANYIAADGLAIYPTQVIDRGPLDDPSDVEGGEEGEETEDDLDEYYDEEEKNGEEEEGQPTKTRFKSTSKFKRGSDHSANRAQNNFWNDEERQYLVDRCNASITKHGLVAWLDDFTQVASEVCNQINAHRSQHPERYDGGCPRGIDSVRSQAIRMSCIKYWHVKAKDCKAKIEKGETVEPEMLNLVDPIKFADESP
ncbi:hypothetical protein AA0111_g11109 [Alternaria arborescens]|uniref:hypothetical protein n=1 Tax=Alternaria arborescens TaxID=156630 RepID=UPI001074F288|nr:hypothetical protein AA0111_g11109 [Alternaria arborescens]RYO17136.1 hypothetical protein AA0111_g11109 [Alternaria arborescens]